MFNAAIVTLSDRGAAGLRAEDLSARAVRESMAHLPVRIVDYQVLPDDRETITTALRKLSSTPDLNLILTTGGTGLAPRDVTPEATMEVVDYLVPGIAEAIRSAGLEHTPMAMLSRAVAGVASGTLIINLPGSPKGVRESLAVVAPALVHALEKLGGDPADCDPQPSG